MMTQFIPTSLRFDLQGHWSPGGHDLEVKLVTDQVRPTLGSDDWSAGRHHA